MKVLQILNSLDRTVIAGTEHSNSISLIIGGPESRVEIKPDGDGGFIIDTTYANATYDGELIRVHKEPL